MVPAKRSTRKIPSSPAMESQFPPTEHLRDVHNQVMTSAEEVGVPQANRDYQHKGKETVVFLRNDRQFLVPPFKVEEDVLESICAEAHDNPDQEEPGVGACRNLGLEWQVQAGPGPKEKEGCEVTGDCRDKR